MTGRTELCRWTFRRAAMRDGGWRRTPTGGGRFVAIRHGAVVSRARTLGGDPRPAPAPGSLGDFRRRRS